MEHQKYYNMSVRYYNKIEPWPGRKLDGPSMTEPGQALTVAELIDRMNRGLDPEYTIGMTNDDDENSSIIEPSYDLVDLYAQFDDLKETIAIAERKAFEATKNSDMKRSESSEVDEAERTM